MQLHRPRTAWDALAARFIHAEFHEVTGNIDHVRVLVHDDHPPGAHDRSDLAEGVIIDWSVKQFCWDTTARRPARLNRLDGSSTRDSAADLLHDRPQRGPKRNLDQSTVGHLAGQAENFRTSA